MEMEGGGRGREREKEREREGESERERQTLVLQPRSFTTVHTVPTVGVNYVISSGRIFQESECCQVTKWP